MKIVWLTPEVPYPPIGGRNGVYNRIVQLSKFNEIYLFSIIYDDKEKKNAVNLSQFCKKIFFFNRSKQKVWRIIKSIFFPYSVATRTFYSMKKQIRRVITEDKIDCIIIDFPNMARNVLRLNKKGLPIYLQQHNIEYKRMRELGEVKSLTMFKRTAYYLESFRLERYEQRLYKSDLFRAITFFSSEDEVFFRKRWKDCHTVLRNIPLGATDPKINPAAVYGNTFLFVGRLDEIAIPNVEAVLWFANHIFPVIARNISSAKFIIAGANPSARIVALQSDHITVIPNYKSLEEVYSKADYVVIPLLSGGGVKGKLLEAVAFRKIVITTDHGIEGTEYKDKDHVILANSQDSFAEACIRVALHPNEYMEMEKRAYKLFQSKYSWETIGREYNEFLHGMNKC